MVGANKEHENVDNRGSADDNAVAGNGVNNGRDGHNGGSDCSWSNSDDKYKSYHDGIGNDSEEKKYSLIPVCRFLAQILLRMISASIPSCWQLRVAIHTSL